MSRTSLAVLGVLVATSLLPSITAPGSGPATFATALVDEAILSGEPGLWLDTSGTTAKVFVVAPGEGVWRSTDAGVTFAKTAEPYDDVDTGGDASLAMDANGVLYLSGLLSSTQTLSTTIPMQVSLDGGLTWTRKLELVPNAGTGVACDRQWTAARGNGESVTAARCDAGQLWRTTNAGVSYTGPFQIASDMAEMGPLFYSPDGNLYTTYWDFTDLRIARSADGGLTWQTFPIAPLFDTRSFSVGAADASGNLYVAWEQAQSLTGLYFEPSQKGYIYMSRSTDDGQTWSAPKLVSDPTRTAIFPWIVAGAAGKVDIAYFTAQFVDGVGPNSLGPSDLGGPVTNWDVVMAQSIDALATNPSWQRVTVVDNFHTGSICTSGIACVGPQQLGLGNAPTPFDRRYLDYFEMRADAAGNAYIVYGVDRPVTNCLDSCFLGDILINSWIDFRVARQTGGTTIG